MVNIYFSHLSELQHDHLLQYYLPQFSSQFQQKIHRYRRWEDAQLSLLGRLLLVHGLKQMGYDFSEEDLTYNTYQKPQFKTGIPKFNISHSGTIAICVISPTHEVGIDIEYVKEIDIHDYRSTMTHHEWQSLHHKKDKKSGFYSYWTQKEAVVKAHGKGLSVPLQSFTVSQDRTVIEGDHFFTKELPVASGYVCHLAWRRERKVSQHDIPVQVFFGNSKKGIPFVEGNAS